jgi:chloramphenicol-sensitive protein RarD
MLRLSARTLLIAGNWFTYIYAVSEERVLESSLGYFITPLVNVLLGILFLRERLRGLQVASLLLAALGVTNLALLGSGIPWLALMLAFSFAFYGLLRKTVAADGTLGLFVETSLLAVPALLLLVVFELRGTARSLTSDVSTWTLLALGGVVTTIPLLLFAGAARRLRMSTLGFLQYLSPTLQFLVAVFVFHEPFSSARLTSFMLIWAAVAIYSFDSYRWYRAHRSEVRQADAAATPSLP